MEAMTSQLPAIESQVQPDQAAPGLITRIGSALRNGYEAVSERIDILKDKATTLAAIGSVAFVGAQAAELTANAEPVVAEGNVPTATASNLEQECVQAALKKPQILKTGIKHAGHKNQFGVLEAQYGDMPEACFSDYRRSSSAKVQTFRNGRWVNISFEGGVVNQTPDSEGNFNPAPQTAFRGEFFQPPDSHAPSWYYHPCRARILLREVVSHPQHSSDSGYHPNPPIGHKVYAIGISPNDIRPHSFRANNC